MRRLCLCFVCGFLLLSCTLIPNLGTASLAQAQSPILNPTSISDHASEGYASWYGPKFAGRQTANGEIFDPSQLTAAHKTLPFGSYVLVTNLTNNRTVTVRINDRGPFKPGRIIDLSRVAAEHIGLIKPGTAKVKLELIDPYAQIEQETVQAETPAPTTYRVASSKALTGFDIVTERYPVGKLLLLSGQGQPIMVRVASNQMPLSSGVDFFVSAEAFGLLGERVSLNEN